MPSKFNSKIELAALRRQTALIRQKSFRKSKLDRYDGQLVALRQAGASYAELQRWLRARRIKAHQSTIIRWFSSHNYL